MKHRFLCFVLKAMKRNYCDSVKMEIIKQNSVIYRLLIFHKHIIWLHHRKFDLENDKKGFIEYRVL